MLQRFWNEEGGAVVSAEFMLVATIFLIGVIAGLKTLRDTLATEWADAAQALSNFDQSFSLSATGGHHGFTSGGQFSDLPDFCDQANPNQAIQESKCVTICSAALHPNGVGADGN